MGLFDFGLTPLMASLMGIRRASTVHWNRATQLLTVLIAIVKHLSGSGKSCDVPGDCGIDEGLVPALRHTLAWVCLGCSNWLGFGRLHRVFGDAERGLASRMEFLCDLQDLEARSFSYSSTRFSPRRTKPKGLSLYPCGGLLIARSNARDLPTSASWTSKALHVWRVVAR